MVLNRLWRCVICENVASCAQLMNPWIGLFDPRRSTIKAQTVWKAITSRIAKQNEKLENIWLASNREREVGIGKSSSIKGSAVLYLNIVNKRLGISTLSQHHSTLSQHRQQAALVTFILGSLSQYSLFKNLRQKLFTLECATQEATS